MTTAQDGPRRNSPLLMWLGHYSFTVIAVCVPVMVTSMLLTAGPAGLALSLLSGAACVTWLAAVFADAAYHSARLCERCAAETPLDPQAAVTRWKFALRFRHRESLPAGLAAVAWFFSGGYLFRHSTHSWWFYTLSGLAFAVIAFCWFATVKHNRLYPWCPWCHWGGGGDEEQVPDPDPEDHGVKPPVLTS